MRKAFLYLLTGLTIANYCPSAFAGIDDSFDWADDAATSKPKRKLKIFNDFKDTDKLGDKLMKDIVKEAIDNWNGAKGDTGWEFVDGGTEGDHDIRIKVGELGKVGGAATSGFDSKDAKTKRVKELTITCDPTPDEGFKWDNGTDNKDDTKNPVSNMKHELSHTIRLDHQKGSDVGSTDDKSLRSETKVIKQPQGAVTKDDDVLTISAKDKEEAKAASTAAIKIAMAPATPATPVALQVPGFAIETSNPAMISLSIPTLTFGNNVDVLLSRTSLRSMPSPFFGDQWPDRLIKGVDIVVSGASSPVITNPNSLFELLIPYDELGIEVNDPEYPLLDESTIQPYFYNPVTHNWLSLDPVAMGGSYYLDTAGDFARMTLPSYMFSQFPISGDSSSSSLFISLAAVPEPTSMALLSLIPLALIRRRRPD